MVRRRGVLIISQHPYPYNPVVARNVHYLLSSATSRRPGGAVHARARARDDRRRLEMADDHAAVRSLRWIEKLATRWADGVITVSEPCRRILGQRGLDTGKVTVLPHTVAYRGPAGPAGGTGDAPHLITHATLIKRHGVQVAIRAMRALAPRCPGLSLRVIGDGEYRPDLEALTAELGLQDRVQFTGKLTWDETMAHFALCHARGRKLRCGRRQAQRPPIASLRWPDVADREYLAALGLAPPPGAPDPAPSSESVV